MRVAGREVRLRLGDRRPRRGHCFRGALIGAEEHHPVRLRRDGEGMPGFGHALQRQFIVQAWPLAGAEPVTETHAGIVTFSAGSLVMA